MSSSWEKYRNLLPSIKSKQGIAVAFVHWRLTSSKHLDCLGTGVNFGPSDNKVGDDALFKTFDSGKKPLRYSRGERRFVLRSHPIHGGADLKVFLEEPGDSDSKSAATVLDLGAVQKDMSVDDVPGWTKKVDDLWSEVNKSSPLSSGSPDGKKEKEKDPPRPPPPTPPAPGPKDPFPEGPPPGRPLPEPMPRFPDPGREPDNM